jgi:starvation-inducible DNA-binding protein
MNWLRREIDLVATTTRIRAKSNGKLAYTVPGMNTADSSKIVAILQDRLNALNDLALTLKHIHWNVVGPHFVAVHTMLDPQVDGVRLMVDETAERIATLGGSPIGTPGALVASRNWDDYSLGRDDAIAHLGALDIVYQGVIEDHRDAIEKTDEPDPVTQDMLIKQSGDLEQYQWFVRAHLETPAGRLVNSGTKTEVSGASRARAPRR